MVSGVWQFFYTESLEKRQIVSLLSLSCKRTVFIYFLLDVFHFVSCPVSLDDLKYTFKMTNTMRISILVHSFIWYYTVLLAK